MYTIRGKSNLLYRQALLKDLEMLRELDKATLLTDVTQAVTKKFQEYYLQLGRPMFTKRYPTDGGLPIVEDYNNNCIEVANNLFILTEEFNDLTAQLIDYFNYRQTEKNHLTERVKYLSGLCTDMVATANIDNPNIMYVKDSFTDTDMVESGLTVVSAQAYVDTRSGVVSLGRTNSLNRSIGGSIFKIQGNGENGNDHIIISSNNAIKYLNEYGNHSDYSAILDGNPDTWLEYQIVNFNDEKKKEFKYDYVWGKGAQTGETLRLVLTIDIGSIHEINWININPYLPANSTGKVTVYSIRTSEDGISYVPLYTGATVLNAELNKTPQTYRKDDIVYDSYIPEKFASQGVWGFKARKTRYIEVVLDQKESYTELLGHNTYKRIITDTSGAIISATRIPEADAPKDAANGVTGKYTVNNTESVTKEIEVVNGWRYCIGVKDINIFSYEFSAKSELITKVFETPKAISRITLQVNEVIPESFTTDLHKLNSWITYEVSLNGHDFYPISPMSHEPISGVVNSTDFPPKIYEVNPINTLEFQQKDTYKGYITTSGTESASSIQMKITFNRPSEDNTLTPLLEDYNLKLYLVEEED